MAPPPAQASESTAYQRLLEREANEKQIKERAGLLYGGIGNARRAQAQLAEERAQLASNPVVNAAQPVQVQRMEAIDGEIKALDEDVEKNLGEIGKLIQEAKAKEYPESWVTGYWCTSTEHYDRFSPYQTPLALASNEVSSPRRIRLGPSHPRCGRSVTQAMTGPPIH